MKSKLVFAFIVLLTSCICVGLASATVTVDSSVVFQYENGTYFTHPGTYDNITRINNVWYFDKVPYSPSEIVSPSPAPSATQLDVITNIFASSLSGLAMFAVVPIISVAGLIISVTLLMKSGEEVDPKIIAAGVVLVIVVNIIAVVGILIINGVHTAMPTTQLLMILKVKLIC